MGVTVVSWNIATNIKPWRQLVAMDADVALLQEARRPPADVAELLDSGPQESWVSHSWKSDWQCGRWPALYDLWPLVVLRSDRVDVEWFTQVNLDGCSGRDEIPVSSIGRITETSIAGAVSLPIDGTVQKLT